MNLFAQIREDFGSVLDRDPAIASKLELFLTTLGYGLYFGTGLPIGSTSEALEFSLE